MKKIFLIFVAAVALSSVAASVLFAEEKYRHTEQIGAESSIDSVDVLSVNLAVSVIFRFFILYILFNKCYNEIINIIEVKNLVPL
mgnify:CR=1 FL=1